MSLRSNDEFGSFEAAERSASIAYPDLEPIVLDPPDYLKAPSDRPAVSRPTELRRLLGIAAGLAAAVGLARWRGRDAADR